MSAQHDNIRTRRQFLAGGALLGSGMVTPLLAAASDNETNAVLNSDRPDAPYELAKPENTIYSACLQCNTGCGIKCKLQDGVVTKIDGNPSVATNRRVEGEHHSLTICRARLRPYRSDLPR